VGLENSKTQSFTTSNGLSKYVLENTDDKSWMQNSSVLIRMKIGLFWVSSEQFLGETRGYAVLAVMD